MKGANWATMNVSWGYIMSITVSTVVYLSLNQRRVGSDDRVCPVCTSYRPLYCRDQVHILCRDGCRKDKGCKNGYQLHLIIMGSAYKHRRERLRMRINNGLTWGGYMYSPKLDHSATFQTLLLLAVGMMHAQHRVAVIGSHRFQIAIIPGYFCRKSMCEVPS